MSAPHRAKSAIREVHVSRGGASMSDTLVVEEPLEIRVDDRPLAVVMRTPGDDLDLAAGFLLTEGVIDGIDDLAGLAHCGDPARPHAENLVLARLAAGSRLDPARFDAAARSMFASSSCGLCGKATIDRVFQHCAPLPPRDDVPAPERLAELLDGLSAAQPVFARTGGCHGAALFDFDGRLLVAREDVGRHNAVDKCLGARLRAGEAVADAARGTVLAVSGRAGFEVVQKAVVGRVSAVVTVGAASSLAHELAVGAGLMLLSFVRGGRGNLHRPDP